MAARGHLPRAEATMRSYSTGVHLTARIARRALPGSGVGNPGYPASSIALESAAAPSALANSWRTNASGKVMRCCADMCSDNRCGDGVGNHNRTGRCECSDAKPWSRWRLTHPHSHGVGRHPHSSVTGQSGRCHWRRLPELRSNDARSASLNQSGELQHLPR